MSLGEIDRRLTELEAEFNVTLKRATSDPTAHREQFKKILDEQTHLKQKRSEILSEDRKNSENELKIQTAKQIMSESLNLTEWDESVIRQLVDTVKVISKDEIDVTLNDGREVRQTVVR